MYNYFSVKKSSCKIWHAIMRHSVFMKLPSIVPILSIRFFNHVFVYAMNEHQDI
jgi:hypothetical protein